MKFVIVLTDPETKVSYKGDVPTSKSWARRWANQYAKEGWIADIAPANNEKKED